MHLTSNEDLVAIARSDSCNALAAFEELVRRHEVKLFNLAMHMLRHREDAEDVVQSAILAALEHIKQFRGDSSFSTWISRILMNKALTVIRTRGNHHTRTLSETPDSDGDIPIPHPQYIAQWRFDAEEIIANRELHEALDRAIGMLEYKYRLVFVLRDIEGMSIEETADLLCLSEANVKVRLLRARLMLREQLTREFGDERTLIQPPEDHDLPAGNHSPVSSPAPKHTRTDPVSGSSS